MHPSAFSNYYRKVANPQSCLVSFEIIAVVVFTSGMASPGPGYQVIHKTSFDPKRDKSMHSSL